MKRAIGFALFVENLQNTFGQRWDRVLEFFYSVFPLLDVGLVVFEECLEYFNELRRRRNVFVENLPSVLIQNRTTRLPEQNVRLRVTISELLLYFYRKIIVGVFGFPKAPWQRKLVEQRPINRRITTSTTLDCVLFNELPTELLRVGLQHILKRIAHRHLIHLSVLRKRR